VKLGTENRKKLITAIVLGGLALVLLVAEFSGWLGIGSSSANVPSTSTLQSASDNAVPTRASKGRSTPGKKASIDNSLDPSLKLDLLKNSEDTRYEGTGRNIFRVFVEIPKPVVAPVTAQGPAQPAVYTPPPPPPIPLTFYGFATPSGGSKRIFLAHGEDVFIAKEGEIVDRRYKVVRIGPNAVEILDVLSNNRQSIPLTQG
jgi:hypothetical protein